MAGMEVGDGCGCGLKGMVESVLWGMVGSVLWMSCGFIVGKGMSLLVIWMCGCCGGLFSYSGHCVKSFFFFGYFTSEVVLAK